MENNHLVCLVKYRFLINQTDPIGVLEICIFNLLLQNSDICTLCFGKQCLSVSSQGKNTYSGNFWQMNYSIA